MSPVPPPEWNQTELDYPHAGTIAELFEHQAALTPNASAVIAQGRRWSYRQIDEMSNRLAHHLQGLGVKPETLVGVAVERSEALVIGLLAILKAGGAYVPLDASYPRERLSYILKDSAASVVLVSSQTGARVGPVLDHAVAIDVADPAIFCQSARPVASNATGSNLAYVIYTSGSTGRPKGVMVEHRNLENFFNGMDVAIGSEPGVWLAVTSAGFDISVLELVWTLTRGFTVVLHGDEAANSIRDEIVRYGVTHLQSTPSLARMLMLDERALSALGSLRKILLGGEAVPASLIRKLREAFQGDIFNMYGPTETTVWSTTYRASGSETNVPIGRPIANTQIYLLNAEGNEVDVGESAELFIGGDGVARGYWNQAALTAERFVHLPFISNRSIYRTGDLARYLPDGNLEFLGRVDFQVKLRGHRIELGEVECVLEECAGVQQAVVVLREDREGDQRLVAYLVGDPQTASAASLKGQLAAKLPGTMSPSAFIFLPALPLTANGKVDRKALLASPSPMTTKPAGAAQIQRHPENDIVRFVSEVWRDALGVEEVGLNENFYDMGAHSLTVAEVHAKLQNGLGYEISIVDLFQFPTISSLCRHLMGAGSRDVAHRASERAQRRRLARQG